MQSEYWAGMVCPECGRGAVFNPKIHEIDLGHSPNRVFKCIDCSFKNLGIAQGVSVVCRVRFTSKPELEEARQVIEAKIKNRARNEYYTYDESLTLTFDGDSYLPEYLSAKHPALPPGKKMDSLPAGQQLEQLPGRDVAGLLIDSNTFNKNFNAIFDED